jgi:spermidine/putrescine transport system permease protein
VDSKLFSCPAAGVSEKSRPRAPLFARSALWIALLALYVPLTGLLIGAFRDKTGETATWTLRWFQEVFSDSTLMESLFNSVIIALSSSLLATAIGGAAAIALHQGGFFGKRFLQGLSFVSLILPEIVFSLALLSWFFLLKLVLGPTTVVLAHVTFSLSYVILTVGARLASFDRSLEDAARDLGAGEFQILFRVTLPLLKPALFAAFLLSFLLSFDDFLITFFVNGVGYDTLPVKLYSSMKTGLTPKLNALATLMWLASAAVLTFAFRSPVFRDVLKAGENTKDAR